MHGAGLQQFELIVSEELNDLCTELEATHQQDTDPDKLLYAAVANILTSLVGLELVLHVPSFSWEL